MDAITLDNEQQAKRINLFDFISNRVNAERIARRENCQFSFLYNGYELTLNAEQFKRHFPHSWQNVFSEVGNFAIVDNILVEIIE